MSTPISRARFLKILAGMASAVAAGKLLGDGLLVRRQIPCRMLGPSMAVGHMIRDRRRRHQGNGSVAASRRTSNLRTMEKRTVTIVGAGIAGLSAAWWLKRSGFEDFVLLELEQHAGGNSGWGRNRISAYPWGAHYVPLANEESAYVRMLFQELGIIEAVDEAGIPRYNELYLCHDPQERLLRNGAFQEGLVPARGLQEGDRQEIGRFFEVVRKLRRARGADGKPAFAIPVDGSSADEEFRRLDLLSMAEWMDRNGFFSKPLRWYVNYCCRDDYGARLEDVSAWAGIHYFAGRCGQASNAEPNSVVTWPEGNGFLVAKLKEKMSDHLRTGAPVLEIRRDGDDLLTTIADGASGSGLSTRSRYVVFAAPRFVAGHIIDAEIRAMHEIQSRDLQYSPWMVANVSLAGIPQSRGAALAWDNVSYSSESLGYVVATHQTITTRPGRTVVTYYFPISAMDPASARRMMVTRTARQWCDLIVEDLERMHPGIKRNIIEVDLWPWGHGMIRPSVGFMWGETRQKMQESCGNIVFAHSDMSGISNFEEAQYRGVEAAKELLSRLAGC